MRYSPGQRRPRGGLMAATAAQRKQTGMEQAAQGSENRSKLLEFKEH